ncbi:MAG: hypothetical protein MUF04_08895 [Akkermansiaceae bacterium]|nr:hypothetical protein [Akkermansiaceae bacterium]
MFCLSASAILAVLAGFLLYHGGGYAGNPLAERHLWGGIAFAVLATLAFIARAWTADPDCNPAFFRLLLFLAAGAMVFAGHDGASLTHGSGYLTAHAPEPLRKVLGLPPVATAAPAAVPQAAKSPEDRLVYADVIAPILAKHCVYCHKDRPTRGNVRLDSVEAMMGAEERVVVLVPGDPAKSKMIHAIKQPPGSPDRMPPEGKPELKPEEIALLEWWVAQGADTKKSLREINPAADIRTAIDALAPAPAADAQPAPAEPAAEDKAAADAKAGNDALKAAVAALAKEFPGVVSFESQASDAVVITAVSQRGVFDDAALAKFAPVMPELVTLDLTGTRVTDQGLAVLAAAKKLRVVRLGETAVTDAVMETLCALPALESVNLYATKVTDAGVARLATLGNLRRLYLWQAAVQPETTAALKEKLPNLEVVAGNWPATGDREAGGAPPRP